MYTVLGMKLIPQTSGMGCWYASAQMVIQWKRERMLKSLAAHPDPSELAETVGWEVAGNGIVNPQVLLLAKALGLAAIPPMTRT